MPALIGAPNPEYVNELETKISSMELENAQLKQQLQLLKEDEATCDQPYQSQAENMLKAYLAIGFRARHALELEESKGKEGKDSRWRFEHRCNQCAEAVNKFARDFWENHLYSMEKVVEDDLYEHFKQKKSDRAKADSEKRKGVEQSSD
jgi:hypothetical protein